MTERFRRRTAAFLLESDQLSVARAADSADRAHFFGRFGCLANQPVLGVDSQNILTDGTYLAILPLGVTGSKTWKRQFSTSAT